MKEIILVIIISLLIGFVVGSYTTIIKVADMASRFIDVDKDLVQQAIYQYQNNIGTCYPHKLNAFDYSYKRDKKSS